MQFDILTIFPNLFNSFLNESLIKKSLQKKVNKICVHDLRVWSEGKHKQVDDRPYGGGAGMVLMAEPIIKAIQEIKLKRSKKIKIILLSPQGKQFDQKMAQRFSKLDQLILICGRYQGVDARIEKFIDEKVSVGPYILSGGELPAMILTESVARLIPGYLGNPKSLEDETFSGKKSLNITWPQYTRPEILKVRNKKYSVPKILLSGDHKKIKEWKKHQIMKALKHKSKKIK